MLGILAILLVTIYMAFLFPIFKKKEEKEKLPDKTAVQVKKLWNIAQVSMRERKPLRAEKALLAILKVDEKNAAAYNRLGILYAKGQKFEEAIECFEIAQSLDNNASSLHNVGLIYYEIGEYEKSAMAFKQALEIEGDMPARYIALAKAEEKMGNRKAAIEALESAFELDHSISTLRQILAIYTAAEDVEAINATNARIEAQAVENAKRKQLERRRMMHLGSRQPRPTHQQRQQIRQQARTQAVRQPAVRQQPSPRQQQRQQQRQLRQQVRQQIRRQQPKPIRRRKIQ